MIDFTLQRELDHPVDKVWDLLADFGNMEWASGLQRVEVEGSGPGMVRRIVMGEDLVIEERLETLDHAARHLTYTIPGNNPMPVTDYNAGAKVTDLGGGRCRVDWFCQAKPLEGIDPAEAEATVRGAYEMMLGWIDDYLKAR